MKRFITLLFLVLCGVLATAQDVPKVTKTLILKNGVLTSSPGKIDSSASVLIKDGIIQSAGANINAPFDARVVDLDSLYIYPGFIAGASHIGVPKPKEDQKRPTLTRPGYPPNDVAGIIPERTISEVYDHNDGSVENFRKQGFTIAHAMPFGRMLPGGTGVISLNGQEYNEAVIIDDLGILLQMRGSGRMFPATEIGVMAKWREMYKNAEYSSKHTAKYNNNPQSLKRPDASPAVQALHDVVSGDKSVWQPAKKHVNISRAINMKKEMGYDLILTEVKQADMAIDMIKSSGAQMLVSLDLPKEIKEEKKDSTKTDMSWKAQEKEALQAKKKKSLAEYTAHAGMIAQADIPVAFSYQEVKHKNIHANIRRMIKAGLSEKDALAALTTTPAQLLGIDKIAGTIEAGKVANMVVTTGPIFDEKSKIKMVIVDGVIYEYDVAAKKKKKAGDAAIDISGEWTYMIEVPGLEPSGTMKITKVGENTYNVVLTNSTMPGEEIKVDGVELDGNESSYEYRVNVQGMNATVESDLTYDEDSFEGMVSVGQFGSFKITGQKVSTPK